MKENLLLIINQVEESELIELNRNVAAENLIKEVNQNPAYLFCYVSTERQLYNAKIAALQNINDELIKKRRA